jgi:ABC-type branched-subunit amino acid transport system ATPase component
MTPQALRVSNLTKDFGGLRAVADISFTIASGEFVGLIGPNGCGKSTTFNCISGLLNSTSGSVEVFGKNVTDSRPDQIQKFGLTRTFQHTRLWKDMTVIENLLVPPRKQFSPNPFLSLFRPATRNTEKRRLTDAYEVLENLEIAHMAHNLASELSGGQSKLVDIGRALMSSPRVLLLDEPVSGVAGPLAEKIFHNLRFITSRRNIAMLVIEHNMNFILRTGIDKIIVMNSGKLLMEGNPDEVRQNSEVIEAYLGDA